MMILKGKWYRIIFTLLATTFVVAALGKEILFQGTLSISSKETHGQVSQDHMEHDACIYTFSIGDVFYTGTGSGCGNQPNGSGISVSFAPEYPSISTNQTPGTNLAANIGIGAVIVLVGFLLGLFRDKSVARD